MAIDLFLKEPPAVYSDWVTQAINQFGNPGFEAFTNSPTQEVGRQRFTDPLAELNVPPATVWYAQTGTVAQITGERFAMEHAMRFTQGPAGAQRIGLVGATFVATTTYTVRFKVRGDTARTSWTLAFRHTATGGSTPTIASGLAIDTNVRQYEYVFTTGGGAQLSTSGVYLINASGNAGEIVEITDVSIETGDTTWRPQWNGSQNPRIRRNITPYPIPAAATPNFTRLASSGWSAQTYPSSGSGLPGAAGYTRSLKSTNGSGTQGYHLAGNADAATPLTTGDWLSIPLPAGVPVTVTVWLRSNAANNPALYRRVHDGNGTWTSAWSVISGSTADVASNPGVWVASSGTITAGVDSFLAIYVRTSVSASWVIGDYLEATGLVVEYNTTLPAVSPLNGSDNSQLPVGFSTRWEGATNASRSYVYDMDLIADWVGTVHGSEQRLRGRPVAGATAGNSPMSSTHWAARGVYSLRIYPTQAAGDDSYAAMGVNTGSGTTGGMTVGVPYTVMATMRLAKPLTGALRADRALSIVVFHRIGAASYTEIRSNIAPNVAGEHDLRLTFTLPVGTTEAAIRVYNGANYGGGEVWVDNFALIQGDYKGPWFWGSTTPSDPLLERYTWSGPIDNSPSVYETRVNKNAIRRGIGNVLDYSVTQEATPLSLSESGGSTPSLNVSIESLDFFSTIRIRGEQIILNDTEDRGVFLGFVDGTTTDEDSLAIRALTPLSRMVGRLQVPPYTGTLGAYIDALLDLVDVTLLVEFKSGLSAVPLVLPSMDGTAWDIIKEVCATYGAEAIMREGIISIRPARTAVFTYQNISGLSHDIDTGSRSRKISVTNLNTTWKTGALMWPLVVDRDDSILSIGYNSRVTTVFELSDISAASVTAPVCVAHGTNIETYPTSCYTILDRNAQPVTPAWWAANGGSATAVVSADYTSVEFTIVSPNTPGFAPFTVAALDQFGEQYPTLRLRGTGAFMAPQVITFPTGAREEEVLQDVGAQVEVGTLANAALVYTQAQKSMLEYSAPTQEISGTVSVPELIALQADILGSETIADFQKRLFSVLVGARFRYGFAYFRVTQITFSPDSMSFDAVADTTMGDLESLWVDQGYTYAMIEPFLDQVSWEDWELTPLNLGSDAYYG